MRLLPLRLLGIGMPLLLIGSVIVVGRHVSAAHSHTIHATLPVPTTVSALQHDKNGHLIIPPNVTVIPYPPGLPAMNPTVNVAADNVTTAAYTADDVRAYLRTHQFFPTTDQTIPQVTQIIFLSAQQARVLLNGESIGRPDNDLVCYVELYGNFNLSRIVHNLLPFRSMSAHKAVLVFDAHTGNLLISGVD